MPTSRDHIRAKCLFTKVQEALSESETEKISQVHVPDSRRSYN